MLYQLLPSTGIIIVVRWELLLSHITKGFGTGFWLHLIGYFIAGALYYLAFGNKRQKVILITFFALFLLGVLFEIVQIYVPHRRFSPKDIAANGLGLAGFYVCHKLISRRQIKA